MKGTSKLPSRHLSADRPLQRLRGCFLGDNAAVPPAYRVKVEKCASFVDILDVCKFTTFCDRKGYTFVESTNLYKYAHPMAHSQILTSLCGGGNFPLDCRRMPLCKHPHFTADQSVMSGVCIY